MKIRRTRWDFSRTPSWEPMIFVMDQKKLKPELKSLMKAYTGVSVSELFGYRDPPFSDSLSEQILSELFGYRDPPVPIPKQGTGVSVSKEGYRYPNKGEKMSKTES